MELNKSFTKGSEWRKWDLHIHSDAGTVDQIVNKIINNDISVFSITDHCSVNNIDEYLKKVVEKQNEGKEIYFLPGIELRTDKGKKSVHLIGIFPIQDKEGNIINADYLKQNLLAKIECSDSDIITAGKTVLGGGKTQEEYWTRGCLEITCDFENTAEQIKQLGGITIVHAGEKSSGIETEMDHAKTEDINNLLNSLGHTKRKLMNNYIDICEIPNWNDSNLRERDFYIKEFKKPSIVSSDSHKLNDIGKKYSWIKADPSLEGLRQIIYEPELRVYLDKNPILYLYPRIISLRLKGLKLYQNKKDKEEFPPINLKDEIFLSSNLTNIIGARGSGKTVLVELLSYPFDRNVKEVKKGEKQPLIQYLAKRFPSLSIEVIFQLGENKPQVLERKINELQDPFYQSPIAFEYWSQGQIEQIAERKEKLNEYIKSKIENPQLLSISGEIDELKEELRKNRQKYLSKIDVEIELKKLLTEKKQIEEYFEKLKTIEYKEIVKKIKVNREKTRIINALIDNIKNVIKSLNAINMQIIQAILPKEEIILEIFRDSTSIIKEIKYFYAFNSEKIIDIINKYDLTIRNIQNSKELSIIAKEDQSLKSEFIQFCERNGIIVTQAEYDNKNKKVMMINEQIRKLEAKEKEFKTIEKTHCHLISQLELKYSEWQKENDKIIKEFNSAYSTSDIKIQWEDPSIKINEWIKNQFKASDEATKTLIKKHFNITSPVRTDYVDDIINELCEEKKYEIEKIVGLLENKKLPALIESMGKSENLKWYFQRDETEILRTDLIMRLKEYAEKGINLIKYKEKVLGRDSMSFGERCGTVVEIILQSGDHPLIIDQPEEHLDSKFIAERAIKILRSRKINRQIIICTHNANIVVLGDAELITALNVTIEGTEVNQGTIENPIIKKLIYDVLEGGPEAFKKREQKYGLMN